MTPFYQRLPNVAGFDVGNWVDPVGLGLTGLVTAAVAMHGIGEVVRHRAGEKSSDNSGSENE
jgi:hypothetical protein